MAVSSGETIGLPEQYNNLPPIYIKGKIVVSRVFGGNTRRIPLKLIRVNIFKPLVRDKIQLRSLQGYAKR